MPNRPRQVLASAIRAAMHYLYDVALTEEQAWYLSDIGSLEVAVSRLSDRMGIVRVAGAETDDPHFQLHLAVAEVVADSKGVMTGSERSRFVGELIQRTMAATEKAEQLSRAEEEIREISGQFERGSRQQRAFVRKAQRLRQMQVIRLQTGIADRESLTKAQGRLDKLYGDYLRRAMALFSG